MANTLNFAEKVVFLSGLPLTLPVNTTDPGSGSPGDMYFNTSSNTVRVYNGTSWVPVQGSGLTGYALNNHNVIVGNGSNLSVAVNTSSVGDILADSTNGLTVAKIAGTTVSSTTGTTNVVFSTGPTVTGAALIGATTITDAATIINTATASKVLQFSLSSMSASTTLTIAPQSTTSQNLLLPNITATDTVAVLGLAQTLSNKTLASPTITGTLTGSSATASFSSLTLTTALAVGSGGTGVGTTPTNGQLLIGNGTNYTLAGLTGTTDQIIVTNGAGTITLSTPQNIDSTASPTFAGLTLTGTPLSTASGGTGSVTALAAYQAFFETVATSLGDLVYGGASGSPTRLAGNITATLNVLTQTGTGSVSAAPAWEAATSTATANAFMVRDSHANVAVNNVNEALATTVTSGSLVTLTASSPPIQQFTGSTAQTVKLPDATTLIDGWQFFILNRSSASITVEDGSGATIQTVGAGTQNTFTLVTNLTTAGSWDYASGYTGILPVNLGGTGVATTPTNGQLLIGNGTGYTVASLTGTANEIVVTPGVGTITLSTPQAIGTGSSPTFASLTLTAPLTVGNGGTGTAVAPTQYGVIYASTASAYASTAQGTAGNIFVGQGAAAPIFTNNISAPITFSAAGTAVTITNTLNVGTLIATSFSITNLTVATLSSTGSLTIDANSGASPILIEASNVQRSTDGTNFITETYVDSTTLTNNSGPTTVTAFTFAFASIAGEEIAYVIENASANVDTRIGIIRVSCQNTGSPTPSIIDMYTETADCGVTWTAVISGSNVNIQYTTTNQAGNRTMRADIKAFRR